MNDLLKKLLILFFIFNIKSSIINVESAILYSYPEGWSDDVLLTPVDPKSRLEPDVDVDGFNNVWAVWDTATWTSGTAEILYSKRDSSGGCLIPETGVSNNPSYSVDPRVAIDTSNNVQFVWRDQSSQGLGLWHAKLANDGSVLIPAHLAVHGAGGLGMSLEIALNKYQNINVAWAESPSGYNQMSYTQLDVVGNPIIEKIRVSPIGLNAYWVGIGVDSFANNHLACRTDSGGISNRLTYSKLDKDGNILISNEVLATGGNNSIVSDKHQSIHIVYTNPAGPGNRIDYLKLNQSGNILIGPQTISTPGIHSNTYPHMAIDTLQYLHVVWQGDSSAIFHVMYCKMDTSGNYVIPAMKIVYPPYTYGAGEPRIAVDRSDRLHVVWVDGRLNPGVGTDIFYKRGENETGVHEAKRLEAEQNCRFSVSPNPFSRMTKINFKLSQNAGSLKFVIFDITGRMVKEFVPAEPEGITYWDGTDKVGDHLPVGVYFLRTSSQDEEPAVPIILLR